jgi:hypothetical protein
MQTATEEARAGNGVDHAADDDNVPRELDIEIDPPVEDNGKTYSTLHLQEPTTGQTLRAEQELAAGTNIHTMRLYQISIVSQVSGVPRSAILKMPTSLVDEAGAFLASLPARGRATGET